MAIGRHVWALALDEPTNYLDLPSIERLEAALSGFPAAFLVVSHDDAFLRVSGLQQIYQLSENRLHADATHTCSP